MENRDEDTVAVVAVGGAVLFIEFGTGVKYPDNHPEAGKNGFTRGGYGYHLGRLKNGWRYTGNPTAANFANVNNNGNANNNNASNSNGVRPDFDTPIK